jgi:hypothetical protein
MERTSGMLLSGDVGRFDVIREIFVRSSVDDIVFEANSFRVVPRVFVFHISYC